MKKKTKLKELALLGLAGGLFVTAPSGALEDKNHVKESYGAHVDVSQRDMEQRLLTEEELLDELSSEGAKVYNSLSPEGKELARYVASQRCEGFNSCKGLNACETEDNKCAGQGDCKGKSKCAFADKNLAVKVAAKKMAEKRANLNNGS